MTIPRILIVDDHDNARMVLPRRTQTTVLK